MKLKNFFWTGEIVTSFSWIVFFLILIFINPYKADKIVFYLFFLTLFFSVLGTVGLLNLRWFLKRQGTEQIKRKIFTSFRHGIMVAVVLTGLLFMQSIDVLSWWDGVVFVLAVVLIEAYFLTKNQ